MKIPVRRFEITASDGLILRGEVFGDRVAKGTPVLCLPGLTRSSRDFHALAERLANDPDNPRFVVVMNSRGRGPSDYDKNAENYSVLTEANDALHVLAAAGLDEAIFIGTSRGGLLTMAIAALRPGVIAGAVLNDIGAIINAQGIARIKTYLTKAKPVESWDDAIAFVKMANFGHFTSLDEDQWEHFAQMTFRDEDGVPKKDFDSAIAKGLEGVDLSDGLPSLWPQFMAMSHCPVLVVRGENSDILDEDVAVEMTKKHPDCQYYEAKGQGHAPLFIIEEVNERVAEFLRHVDETRAAEEPSATPAMLSEDQIVYLDPKQEPEKTVESDRASVADKAAETEVILQEIDGRVADFIKLVDESRDSQDQEEETVDVEEESSP